MNYFAHGRRHLDDPYLTAGTAVPDWLSVVNRSVRVRQRQAAPFVGDADPRVASVARGIVEHHRDDAWFHATDAFGELSLCISARCREALSDDDGYRPSFLGHVLVELLIDAALAAAEPERLHRYYVVLETLDPATIEAIVGRIAGRSADGLAWFIERFCAERFLWDYADDGRLIHRLNQVLRRVKLPALPESFSAVLTPARQLVGARMGDLTGMAAEWEREPLTR